MSNYEHVLVLTDDTIMSKAGQMEEPQPCCNVGNIMHNMVAISYWHPSRVNTDTEQKEHSSQYFSSPSLCHLFSVSLALSWLNSSSRDRPCGRAPTLSPSLIPPPSTATLEVLQTCTCLWGFIQSRPHTRRLHRDSICSRSVLYGTVSVVLFRQNNSLLGMDTISVQFIH